MSTISTNVRSTVSTNHDDKKLRYKMDYHTLHELLIVIILLSIIVIIGYHHKEHKSKRKHIGDTNINIGKQWIKKSLH